MWKQAMKVPEPIHSPANDTSGAPAWMKWRPRKEAALGLMTSIRHMNPSLSNVSLSSGSPDLLCKGCISQQKLDVYLFLLSLSFFPLVSSHPRGRGHAQWGQVQTQKALWGVSQNLHPGHTRRTVWALGSGSLSGFLHGHGPRAVLCDHATPAQV